MIGSAISKVGGVCVIGTGSTAGFSSTTAFSATSGTTSDVGGDTAIPSVWSSVIGELVRFGRRMVFTLFCLVESMTILIMKGVTRLDCSSEYERSL